MDHILRIHVVYNPAYLTDENTAQAKLLFCLFCGLHFNNFLVML